MSVANSAAQVSTRLYTGCRPWLWRSLRISLSATPASLARRASAKPLRFRVRRNALFRPLMPASATCSSAHQLFNLHREPAVDVGQVEDAVNRQTGAEGVGDVPDAVRAGVFQLAADLGQRFRIVQLTFGSKPVAPTSRPRSAFAATPAGCGRWPSLRRPTSSGWSGGRWRRRTSRS